MLRRAALGRATSFVASAGPAILSSCQLFTSSDDRPVLQLCWQQAQARGLALARPVVVDSLVIYSDGAGNVVAYDRKSGSMRWRTRVDTAFVLGERIVAADGVLVVPVAGYTVGLDVGSGQERWRYEAPLDIREYPQSPRPGYVGSTRPDASGGMAFIPAWGASVSGVDLVSGRPRWIWTPGDSVEFRSGSMGVRARGDTVYATVWHNITALGGMTEQWLVALDRLNGRELWRVVFPSYTGGVTIQTSPAIASNLVIANSTGGYEFAVDRFSRVVVWQFTPTPAHATFAGSEVYGDVVYHDGGDNFLYALRVSDGGLLWKAPIDGQPKNDFLVTDRHIVLSVDPSLIVLDRATGRRVASISQPGIRNGRFYSAPGYFDGRIYVAGEGAALCFLEPR